MTLSSIFELVSAWLRPVDVDDFAWARGNFANVFIIKAFVPRHDGRVNARIRSVRGKMTQGKPSPIA